MSNASLMTVNQSAVYHKHVLKVWFESAKEFQRYLDKS